MFNTAHMKQYDLVAPVLQTDNLRVLGRFGVNVLAQTVHGWRLSHLWSSLRWYEFLHFYFRVCEFAPGWQLTNLAKNSDDSDSVLPGTKKALAQVLDSSLNLSSSVWSWRPQVFLKCCLMII